MSLQIDINCDLGEGIGNDEDIMPYIQSCSIACGGHYGNVDSIRYTIRLAKEYGVKIGAHPSFPDKANFGREIIEMHPRELMDAILKQVNLFVRIAQEEEVEVHHVKLHGALYNLAAKDSETALLVIDALGQVLSTFKLYTPYGSVLSEEGKKYFPLVQEAFIDRTYQENGNLTPRTNDDALIINPQEAWEQIVEITKNKRVKTTNGSIIPMEAETFCIHSDSAEALHILRYIHQQMNNA